MLNALMTFENFQDFRIMMADKAASKNEFVNRHNSIDDGHNNNHNYNDEESKMGIDTNNNNNDNDVWACYQCTYVNEIRFATCQICGALGPENVQSTTRNQMNGNSKTRDINDIIEDLERQKKICRRSQFRIPDKLMNQLYDLIGKNPNPSNKDIVKIFQSDSSVNMLMTNPSQVSTLVDELKKLNVLENELLMSTASNDENNMNYKKTSDLPSKPIVPRIRSQEVP